METLVLEPFSGKAYPIHLRNERTKVIRNVGNQVILLGNTEKFSLDPSALDHVMFNPLEQVTLTGEKDTYGTPIGNAPATLHIFDGSYSSASLPPVTDTNTPLAVILNQTITAGSTITVTPPAGIRMPVSSYLSLTATMFAQSKSSPQGANPYYRCRLQWSNSNDNFDAQHTQDWVCATGPLSFTKNFRHDCAWNVINDTLTMQITNYDTVDIGWTIGLFGSYRAHSNFVRGRYPDDLSAEAAGLGSDNILLSLVQAAIPASSVGIAAQIPLYNGDVVCTGTLSGESAAGAALVRIQPMPAAESYSQIILRSSHVGFLDQPSFKLPRRACTVLIDNSAGTTPVTPNLLFVASDNGI